MGVVYLGQDTRLQRLVAIKVLPRAIARDAKSLAQFEQEARILATFFRHEVYLTYRRIQDIHVTRNIIERWMGLAKVPIQTASGTSGATMKIEGIRNPEPLRDYLYERMRGARGLDEESEQAAGLGDQALVLLREIRDELRSRQGAPS